MMRKIEQIKYVMLSIVSLILLDMSQIKKFFSKVKSEVKFARAGEGHRLDEPSAPRSTATAPARPPTTARQSSDGGAASRAAAEAAQQRFQQQMSMQQASGSSRRNAHIEVMEG